MKLADLLKGAAPEGADFEPQRLEDVLAMTANPVLARQVAMQRAANPRPDVTDVMGYGPNWSEYWANFKKNLAEQFPTPGATDHASVSKLLGLLGITAYHGSPHKFTKFDMSKVGTGEGAQAYGHGLYFAENPGVARTYSADRAYVGAAMRGQPKAINYDDPMWIAQKTIDELGDATKAKAHLEMVARTAAKNMTKESAAAVDGAINLIASGGVAPKGSLYKVDIPDEAVGKMLDWDKPLSQQPESVRSIFKEKLAGARVEKSKIVSGYDLIDANGKWRLTRPQPFSVDDLDGATLYKVITGGATPADASGALKAIGIPGIRYLDQGSRAGGKGTSNFVVFDDQLPKIVGRE